MQNGAHQIKRAILWVVVFWVVFDLGTYLTYSEYRNRLAGTQSLLACGAYLAALMTCLRYNCGKQFRGHVSLWASIGMVALAFGAAGYAIEQEVDINANSLEKGEGGLIFGLAIGLGLVTALISSVSILGNRLLNHCEAKGRQE